MTISNSFVPNRQIIQNISNSNPGVITTTQPHGYDNDLSIRVVYPPRSNFGMAQLANQVFQITVIDPTNFSIPIDTRPFEPFSTAGQKQVPQIIPVAEIGYDFSEAVRNNNNIVPET